MRTAVTAAPRCRARCSHAEPAPFSRVTTGRLRLPGRLLGQRRRDRQSDKVGIGEDRLHEIGAALEELHVDIAAPEGRVGHEPAMKALVGGDAGDDAARRAPVDIRAIACSRSGAQTISLASIES